MTRLYQRIILVVLLIAASLGLYYIKSSTSDGGRSAHLFDSVSHLSLNNQHNNGVKNEIPIAKGKEKDHHEKPELLLEPCTALSPLSHHFIDLSSLSSKGNDGKALPWTSKGFNSEHNFTLGVCSSPFKKAHDKFDEVKDISNSTNVGAYYIDQKLGKYVSMGQYSTTPVVRGKKLTLTYTNGSYCENMFNKETGERVRKSTLIMFTCDREILSKATASFVGSFNDCSYVFEVRSHHACPTAAKADNLAVIWIFLLILLAALAVYFSGGLLYRQIKLRNAVVL